MGDCAICRLTSKVVPAIRFCIGVGASESAVVEVSQAQLSRVIATQLPSLCAQLPVGLVAPDRLAVRFCGSDDKPQLFVVA